MTNKLKKETLTTINIKEALEEYASQYFIKASSCTFIINKVQTFINTSTNDDFHLLNANIREIYKDKDKIINENIKLQQHFNITILPKKRSDISLDYSIDYGEHSINPKLILKTSSKLPYKEYKAKEFYIHLVKEINKIKAYSRIIINLYDESMIKNIKSFTKYLYAGKFTNRIKISLFDGVEPDVDMPAKLIIWYEENNINQKIKEVDEGELLVEYKKASYGKNGFNAFGEIINKGKSDKVSDLDLKIDTDTITIIEDKNTKQYISKQKGFVNIVDKTLLVDNKVNIQKISRIDKTIVTDEDNNIEVFVSQDDTNQDSVGEGVKLISETIHIKGHVGANSVLESVNLKVDGATHNGSKQFTKYADIHRHKGTLRCNTAKIDLLEGGEVHATTVEIGTCLNGAIYAQDVIIDQVKSHLKVFASNSITINRISGEDNILKINYKQVPILNAKLAFMREEMIDLKYKLKEAKRHNIAQVDLVKSKIIKLKDEFNAIKNSTKNAKITIDRPINGYNTIIFEFENGEKISYKTQTSKYEPFYLEIDEDEEDIVTLQPINKNFLIKGL